MTSDPARLASSPSSSPPPTHRPLSYEDLRRFLFLCLSLALAALLIKLLGPILMLFVVVGFLVIVLNPFVVWLEKRGLRRPMGVPLTMLALVGITIGLGFLVVPTVVEQVRGLYDKRTTIGRSVETQLQTQLERFPQLKEALPPELRDAKKLKLDAVVDAYTPNLQKVAKNAGPNAGKQLFNFTLGLLTGLFTLVLALLLTTFALLNPVPLVSGFLCAVPERHRGAAGRSFARIENQMVGWIRATLINGLITGVSTGVILYFVGVQPALVFGVLSFFGEFVPNIGPVVASVPALFVAAGLGTTKFLLTCAAIVFVQQVESNLLVPFVMGRELELHPVTIVFFALSMGALFGMAGAILAVPTAVVVKVLFDEFYLKPNAVPEEALQNSARLLVQEKQWEEPERAMLS